MQLESVLTVSMCGFLLEVCGEVDDRNSREGTLLHANVATDAQLLRNESNLGRRSHLDTELKGSQGADGSLVNMHDELTSFMQSETDSSKFIHSIAPSTATKQIIS